MSNELPNIDAVGLAELVRSRQVSPVELVEAAAARIESLNPALNAVTHTFFERSLQQARAGSLPNGPFRGVPFLLKDFFCHTTGDPYYERARFLRELDWHEGHDTYLAAKFRAAGFVLLGKTNVPELANGAHPDDTSAYGRTNNPWNLVCSPGGSSSGSCAAVAARMVAVAHANDGTGSIRLPASACGLVALKPSRGRVSAGPRRLPFLLGNLPEHVVTRTVRDSAAVLDAITGSMPGDLYTAHSPARPFASEVGRETRRLKSGDTPGGRLSRSPGSR